MEIGIVIVVGLVVMTVVAVVGDYLTKSKLAQGSADPGVIQRLEARVADLEKKTQDQEAKLLLLEDNVAFTTKLLEKRPE